jgi:hypothetical protein
MPKTGQTKYQPEPEIPNRHGLNQTAGPYRPHMPVVDHLSDELAPRCPRAAPLKLASPRREVYGAVWGRVGGGFEGTVCCIHHTMKGPCGLYTTTIYTPHYKNRVLYTPHTHRGQRQTHRGWVCRGMGLQGKGFSDQAKRTKQLTFRMLVAGSSVLARRRWDFLIVV